MLVIGNCRLFYIRTIAPDTTCISPISEQSNNRLSDVAQFLPEVEAAQVRIDIARRDLQIARAAYYPTVSLSVDYGSSYSDALKKCFRIPTVPIGTTPILF